MNMYLRLAISLLVIIQFSLCVSSEGPTDRPIVATKQGKVQGVQDTNLSGRSYYAFWGIPYAKAPLGERRFKKPEMAESWGEAVKDAREEGSACRQFELFMNKEYGTADCLFINVFTPQLNPTEKKAVIVWVHGGGYNFGNGGLPLFGPGKLMDHDVVLVSFNYRLGVFGFLSTGDEVIPGNNGMWDQVLALKWVQENIAAFGGDPSRVTIFGESAGGSSVSLLALSPATRGLFKGAIIQSGTEYSPWAMQEDPLRYAQMLASDLNCPTDTTSAMSECLVGKTDDELFNTYKKTFPGPGFPQIYFSPVVEGPSNSDRFLPDHPSKLMKSKRHNQVPVIIGVMQNEGGLLNLGYNIDRTFVETYLSEVLDVVSDFNETHLESVADAVRKEYFSNVDFNNQQQLDTAVQEVITDLIYNAPTDKKARKLIKSGATVYKYVISYRGQHSFAPTGGFSTGESLGPVHFDEIKYLFDMLIIDGGKLTGDDVIMSNRLLTMWTNFAKTGNPTPSITEEIPIKWEPVRSKDDLNYLNIGKDLTMESNHRADKVRFWNKYLPKVVIKGMKVVEKEEL